MERRDNALIERLRKLLEEEPVSDRFSGTLAREFGIGDGELPLEAFVSERIEIEALKLREYLELRERNALLRVVHSELSELATPGPAGHAKYRTHQRLEQEIWAEREGVEERLGELDEEHAEALRRLEILWRLRDAIRQTK